MKDDIDPSWPEDERMLASRIRASVEGLCLPPGFSARLATALAARRRARRGRAVAAAAVVAALAAAAAFAFSSSPRRGAGEIGSPRVLARGPAQEPGAELAAGWTIAGICRSLRRRRREDGAAAPDEDFPEGQTHTP